LRLDRKQANRHDAEVKLFTENCVLNRLGVAAGESNIAGVLEFAGSSRAGKTLPGITLQPGKIFLAKVEVQVSGHRKIASKNF
jgi:hypothetical protein